MNDNQSYFLTDPPPIAGERKALFTLVLTIAVLGVILWGLQIRNSITAPYALSSAPPSSLKQELVDNNIDYLKEIDTSGNGISDYDKIFVYGTSRYLYDSYGYGMSDKDVIAKGLALCPGAGKNCGGIYSADGGAVAVATSTTVFNEQNPLLNLEESGLESLSGPEALDKMLKDPKQLRNLLIQTGRVSTEDLKNVSDADLVKTAQLLFASTTEAVLPNAASPTPRQ